MRCVIEARWKVVLSIVAAVCICPVASWAQTASTGSGQSFPSKLVRYVVPFGAGGSPDIVGRLLADRLTRLWGQQVIVENRVGVAGVMGTAFVAKSPPDGYTLVQCNVASSGIGVSLFAKMPYDQLRDLAPVTRIGLTPNIVTVHPSVPIKTIKEFIAYAKGHPGELSYASGLVGTSPQLSMELFKSTVKVDIVNIPYKVAAQGITDTIGGQVPVNISNVPAIVAPIQSGRLRALAITSAKRIPQLPSVPTMQEAGLPGYEVNSWYGVCAPAATPAPVLEKLHADINAVLRMPEMQKRLNELVLDTTPTTREEFDQFIRAEIARWAQVIKVAGIPQQ
jgi:tripartite-type tricarboxylate transporter receptor subunit TctC